MHNIASAPNRSHPYLPPIPENWEYVKLEDLILYMEGGIPPKGLDKQIDGGVPYIRSQYIKGNKFIEYNNEIQRIDPEQVSKERIFEPDSLFITRAGDNAGRASMIKEHAVAHQGIIMAYFDPEKVYGEYVYWWLKTKAFQTVLVKLSNNVAQKSLNQKKVNSIDIPLPYPKNFPESRKIQHYILQRINSLIPEVNDAKNRLEDMSRDTNLILDATLNEIFNNDIKQAWPNNRTFKNAVSHLSKELSPEQLGPYKHLQHIGGADIEKGTCRLLNERTLEQTKEQKGPKNLFNNAVLYQNLNPELRKVVYVPGEGTCSIDIIPFQPDRQLMPRFLMWFLASPYFYTENYTGSKEEGHTDRPRINLNDIEKYSFYYPSLEDQEQIVNRLDHIQKQVGEIQTILEEEKELLKQLEFSILDRAFRGEL